MNAGSPEFSVEIGNDLAEIGRVTEILDGFWVERGLDGDAQADLNIAIEEILSNAMRHGALAAEPILLRVAVGETDVCVEIEDRGIAFDPLAHELPDPKVPLAQRRAGGLGILMVTQMMDETRYERRGERNCFWMRRRR